jgi:putative redox protein
MSAEKYTTATWTGDLEFRIDFPPGESVTFTSVPADARPGSGPSPMEAVQAAVVACTGMDVVLILRRMRKAPEALRVEVDARRRTEDPKVYTHLRLIYHVDGDDLDLASVRRAIELSQNKYCSVAAMLRPTVEFSFELILNGEAVELEAGG